MTDAPEMAVWSKEYGMESAGPHTPCDGPAEYVRIDKVEALRAENDMTEDIVKRLRSGAKTADTITLAGVEHDPRSLAAAGTIEALRDRNERLRKENERLREALDACNITSLIAHALSDGHIAEAAADHFETALNDMNAALNHHRPEEKE